jgi:hypothetical protein
MDGGVYAPIGVFESNRGGNEALQKYLDRRPPATGGAPCDVAALGHAPAASPARRGA